jgi:tRNA pseudouridine38-40 synthase
VRNIRLVISYDGSDFHGWQTQPGKRTVQQTLEEALLPLTGGQRVRVNASGRTDAGVHAIGQVVNFLTTAKHEPAVFVRALNVNLPDDVSVRAADEVAVDFCANRSALSKIYRYLIYDGDTPDPFLRKYAYRCPFRLDHQRMRQAARALLGTHDFHSFETDWPNRASSVRTMMRISVNRVGDYLWIDAEADGFLYNMMRAIAGTLIQVGRGYWPVERVAEILQVKDRREAGPTAPPQGLYLLRVKYAC